MITSPACVAEDFLQKVQQEATEERRFLRALQEAAEVFNSFEKCLRTSEVWGSNNKAKFPRSSSKSTPKSNENPSIALKASITARRSQWYGYATSSARVAEDFLQKAHQPATEERRFLQTLQEAAEVFNSFENCTNWRHPEHRGAAILISVEHHGNPCIRPKYEKTFACLVIFAIQIRDANRMTIPNKVEALRRDKSAFPEKEAFRPWIALSSEVIVGEKVVP
ncbi:Hypothetical protein NTJ_14810 [Nesidiocoris tenuis]|nr:Hypothetical protein NTJ_14810 [Nesidiocoris tenuis]